MRTDIHQLIKELDELREWMLEVGVLHAKAGDLELNLDPDAFIARPPTEEGYPVEAIERPGSVNPYDDPDLYAAVGGDPLATGKQAGEAAMK